MFSALALTLLLSGAEVHPPLAPIDNLAAEASAAHPEERLNLGDQLVRMVLGLGFVVALIYVLGKVVVPKALKLAPMGGAKTLHVAERIPLDAKHALFLVNVEGAGKLLIGTSENSVHMLKELGQVTHDKIS